MSRASFGEAVLLLSLLAALGAGFCFARAAVFVRRFPAVHPVTMNTVRMTSAAALLLAGAAHRRVDASNPSAQRPGLRSPTWCRSARSWSSRSTSLCSGTGPRPERPMGSCSSRLSPSSSRPGSTTSGSASDRCSEVCSCWRECMSVRYVPRDRPRPESGFSACQRLSRSHGKGRCPKRRHLDPEEGGVSFDPKLTNCAFG